jgi:hypothetical protein
MQIILLRSRSTIRPLVRPDFPRFAELPNQFAAGEVAAIGAPFALGFVVVVVVDASADNRGAHLETSILRNKEI